MAKNFCGLRVGFSLVEMVMVFGIISFLFGIGAFFSYGVYQDYLLLAERDLLATVLKKVRSRALSNFNQSNHGVFIDTDNRRYVIFQGNLYSSRNQQFDEFVGFESSVEISGTQEIVFQRLSGETTSSKSVVLSSPRRQEIVEVNQEGRINY